MLNRTVLGSVITCKVEPQLSILIHLTQTVKPLIGRAERAHLVVSSARIFYLYNYIYTYNKLDIYYIYDAPSS